MAESLEKSRFLKILFHPYPQSTLPTTAGRKDKSPSRIIGKTPQLIIIRECDKAL
jgi:hypothetical protein